MVGRALIAVSLGIGGLVAPGVAHAENIMNLGQYAGDVIKQLQDWGYNVALNGLDRDIAYMTETEKRECQVLGLYPTVTAPLNAGEFQTVYVQLSCPGNPSSTSPSGT